MGDLRCSFINKFACGNFRTAAQGSAWRGFLLTHFGFNRFARASRDLLCSTHSGVTCPPLTPYAAWQGFDPHPGRALWADRIPNLGSAGATTVICRLRSVIVFALWANPEDTSG